MNPTNNAPGGRVQAGRVQGRRNVKSGHMAKIQRIGCVIRGNQLAYTPENLAKLAEMRKDTDLSAVGTLGAHVRWHLNRAVK